MQGYTALLGAATPNKCVIPALAQWLTITGDVIRLRRLFAFVEVKTRNGDLSTASLVNQTRRARADVQRRRQQRAIFRFYIRQGHIISLTHIVRF
jgi:hypothetical protein